MDANVWPLRVQLINSNINAMHNRSAWMGPWIGEREPDITTNVHSQLSPLCHLVSKYKHLCPSLLFQCARYVPLFALLDLTPLPSALWWDGADNTLSRWMDKYRAACHFEQLLAALYCCLCGYVMVCPAQEWKRESQPLAAACCC